MTASTTAVPTIGSPATNRVADRRTNRRLLVHQLRYELRTMRRNPTLLGFTIGMPLAMMLIFAELMGNEDLSAIGVLYKEYLAPRMVVLAILTSSFVSLAISVSLRRGNGELKRVRSTPMPAGLVIAALGITTASLSLVSATSVMVTSWWVFAIPPPALVPTVLVLVVGCATGAALGLAMATFIRRPDNAIAVSNGVLWPVVFISGTYTLVATDSLLDRIAGVLPVRHLNDAAQAASSAAGGTIAWWDVGVVAAWGVVAAAVALRRFEWEPHTKD